MLSRDPAYSVGNSLLGTETTAVMMQFTYATSSDLPKRVIQETVGIKPSNIALAWVKLADNDAPGESSGADLIVFYCNCRASVRSSDYSGHNTELIHLVDFLHPKSSPMPYYIPMTLQL